MSGKKKPPEEPVERVTVNKLRTLGAESNADPSPPVERLDEALAERARATLEAEFERVFSLKEKFAAEAKVGGAEKGRRPEGDEKFRSLIASLEGMNRFALAMGLLTPAESRELYAQAMKRGLYQGWK